MTWPSNPDGRETKQHGCPHWWERDACSFSRLPGPPSPDKQNTQDRIRKPAASPIGAEQKDGLGFQVASPALGSALVPYASTRACAKLSPGSAEAPRRHSKARQCMRTSRDATAYQSPGTLRNGLLRPWDGGTSYLLPPDPGCESGRG